MELPFEEILLRLERIENLLIKEKNNQITEAHIKESNRFLTIEEAARFLNLTKGSLYQLVHKGKIPYSKRGRLYFSEKELQMWIQTGRQQTVQEIQAEAINALKERP